MNEIPGISLKMLMMKIFAFVLSIVVVVVGGAMSWPI